MTDDDTPTPPLDLTLASVGDQTSDDEADGFDDCERDEEKEQDAEAE